MKSRVRVVPNEEHDLFDGIAGALQEYLEDRLQAWTLDHVKHTGIHRIVFSGGVAQNIKAMKLNCSGPCIIGSCVYPVPT